MGFSGGGLYSTLYEMSTLAHAFLDRTLLPESTLFGWMKPNSFTSTLQTVVGMPWEIYRAWDLTPKYPQIHDIYSKGGSSFSYSCKLSFFDQYGTAVLIMTAGDALSRGIIFDTVVSVLVPMLEEETRAQAQKNYAKWFETPSTSNSSWSGTGSWNASTNWNASTHSNSTDYVRLKISLDKGPGLLLHNLTRGNYDIVAALPEIYQTTFADFLAQPIVFNGPQRLYPTEIRTTETDKTGRKVIKEDWRIKFAPVFDTKRWNGTDLPGRGQTSDECSTWLDSDWIHYGGQPMERVVFVKDAASGEVIGAELPWLRANLKVSQ